MSVVITSLKDLVCGITISSFNSAALAAIFREIVVGCESISLAAIWPYLTPTRIRASASAKKLLLLHCC